MKGLRHGTTENYIFYVVQINVALFVFGHALYRILRNYAFEIFSGRMPGGFIPGREGVVQR
jgi:hypothetical protein